MKQVTRRAKKKQAYQKELFRRPLRDAQAFVDGLQATKSTLEDGKLVQTMIPDHSIRVSSGRAIFQLLQLAKTDGGGDTFNFNFNATPTTPADGDQPPEPPKRSFIDA